MHSASSSLENALRAPLSGARITLAGAAASMRSHITRCREAVADHEVCDFSAAWDQVGAHGLRMILHQSADRDLVCKDVLEGSQVTLELAGMILWLILWLPLIFTEYYLELQASWLVSGNMFRNVLNTAAMWAHALPSKSLQDSGNKQAENQAGCACSQHVELGKW